MNNTDAAFHWIIHLLEDLHIQYLIDGGLAARAYGVTRPLADIDIDVAEKDIPRLLPHVQEYIIFGPARYKSDLWDLFLLTQDYQGQKIDIGGANDIKLFNRQTHKWDSAAADFRSGERKKFSTLMFRLLICLNLLIIKKGWPDRLIKKMYGN